MHSSLNNNHLLEVCSEHEGYDDDDNDNKNTTCKHRLPTFSHLWVSEIDVFHKALETRFGSRSTDQNQPQLHTPVVFAALKMQAFVRNMNDKTSSKLFKFTIA